MTLNNPMEIKTQQLCSVNKPISLNNLPVKVFALYQHQMHFSIALMSSSYSTGFRLSLSV